MRYVEQTNGNTILRAGHVGAGQILIQAFPTATVKDAETHLNRLSEMPRFAGWKRKEQLLQTRVKGWKTANQILEAFGGDGIADRTDKLRGGRPTTLPDPWHSLAEKLGSVQALAEVLDCDVRTVRRWAVNLPKSRRAIDWIRAAFHAAGIEPPC